MSKAIIDRHTLALTLTLCAVASHKIFSVCCMNLARHCLISSYLSVIGLTLYFTTHSTKTSPTVILLNLIYVERQQTKNERSVYTYARTIASQKREKIVRKSHKCFPYTHRKKSNQTKQNKKWKHLFHQSVWCLYTFCWWIEKKNIWPFCL